MTPPQVLVFAGSLRADSLHRKLARAALAPLRDAGGSPRYVELRDYPMPLYDGDLEVAEGMPDSVRQLREVIQNADALAIASPEYNGSFSPLVKNVVDWLSRPVPGERPLAVYNGKVAGLLSGSPGQGGGRRGLRHLRELLEMIGVRVIAEEVIIPRASQAFDREGRLTREADAELLGLWSRALVSASSGK